MFSAATQARLKNDAINSQQDFSITNPQSIEINMEESKFSFVNYFNPTLLVPSDFLLYFIHNSDYVNRLREDGNIKINLTFIGKSSPPDGVVSDGDTVFSFTLKNATIERVIPVTKVSYYHKDNAGNCVKAERLLDEYIIPNYEEFLID
jgi:hypothetical protein